MCRQKGYTPERDEHIQRWNLEDSNQSYNEDVYYATAYVQQALTDGLPIITRNEQGQNISQDAFWGLLAPWKQDFTEARTAANNFVNIRSETVHESKLYAPLIKKKQRCLIPCSYYFEHHHFDQFGKKAQLLKAKLNVPFLVKVNRRILFAIPGLYSHWYDKENKKNILTYSMFTVVANDLMGEVHNGGDNPGRMPLVIDREMEERWLDPATTEKDINELLNYQIYSDELRVHAVAPLTGSKAKEGAAIIEEEFWNRKEEIEEIKNTGKQKQDKTSAAPV